MSDIMLVRGIDASVAQPLFDLWKKNRKWVRSVAHCINDGSRKSWK